MKNFIITIDGPAASGKSTVARILAKKLGASFLDTGAMYRAVTFAAMESGIDLANEEKLLEIFERNNFSFTVQNNSMMVQIDGNDATEFIRRQDVTANAKYIASAPLVREKLVQMQRQFASENKAIVTEGRDQGTVAFPNADIKFFMSAQPGERARRRLAELKAKGINENIEQTQESIEKRDKSDMERNVGPLKPADDAIIIDTTELDIEQVVDKLLCFIREKGFSE
ncbi:MAG: (d)CMP kinase [Sedimentisphaerales bacterium]|nr:(d)CMP kinase [Sedimentisphaerales bacterium]